MEPDTVATPTYGKACANCAKSKCRCVRRQGRDVCERCFRLNKQCHPSQSIRRSNAETESASKIARLENRLDELASALKSVAQSTSLGASISNPVDGLLHQGWVESVSSPSGGGLSSRAVTSSSGLTPGASASDSSFSSIVDSSRWSPEYAEKCLDIFKNQMLKSFAFIHLPAEMTAQMLRQQRPFLYLCMIAVTTKATAEKLALFKDIRQILAQRLLLELGNTLDIDLLLGMMTYLVWGNEQLFANDPKSLSRYTHLTMTICFDLRLNKPWHKEINMLPKANLMNSPMRLSNAGPTLEERRAVLGCFALSSLVASYLALIDPMQWTPYMDECLQVLSESKESISDQVFLAQVRCQLLSQRIPQAAFQPEDVGQSDSGTPVKFYLKAIQLNLDKIKGAVSPELQEDMVFLAARYHAELSVCEMALSQMTTTSTITDFQQLECLYSCLNTVKSAFENFFSVPVSSYYSMSFLIFAQFARSIVVLYKLTTFDHPGWDIALVRSTIDLISILDHLLVNMEQAGQMSFDGAEDNVARRTVRIFTSVRSYCGSKLGVGTGQTVDGTLPQPDESGIFPDSFSVDSMDDVWLKNVFTSWVD